MARLALSTLIAALVPTAAPVAAAPGDGAIAGRLTEVGTGDALPDLCVRAYDASLGRIDSETVPDGEDTTSTNGRYRVTGLDPADEYKLFFGCDFAPEREKHIVEWFSNRSSYRRADPVPVLPGQTTPDIDASLRLGGVVSGSVRDGDGAGRGFCIEATNDRGETTSTGPTTASGEYAIGGLRSGDYTVRFRDCREPDRLADEYYRNTSILGDADLVSVTAGTETADVDARLTIAAPNMIIRRGGATRIETAAKISRSTYPAAGSAGAVVLSRDDDFADALAAGPLAVVLDAPILLTDSEALDKATEDEILRVLPKGETVYLLGGFDALHDGIAIRLTELGYRVERIGGDTRYDTALMIADRVGDPRNILIAVGDNFPDGLAASAAAAAMAAGNATVDGLGVIVLTPSEQRHAKTDAYLAAHPSARRYAIGGPAARPYPEAQPVFGEVREETATDVAATFFGATSIVGIARSDNAAAPGTGWADALTGAPHIGRSGGPMLLTPTTELNGFTRAYLCARWVDIDVAYVYGGHLAITPEVAAEVRTEISRYCRTTTPVTG